jgi:hypothetical protein
MRQAKKRKTLLRVEVTAAIRVNSKNIQIYANVVRFQVFTAVALKNGVFWYVMP